MIVLVGVTFFLLCLSFILSSISRSDFDSAVWHSIRFCSERLYNQLKATPTHWRPHNSQLPRYQSCIYAKPDNPGFPSWGFDQFNGEDLFFVFFSRTSLGVLDRMTFFVIQDFGESNLQITTTLTCWFGAKIKYYIENNWASSRRLHRYSGFVPHTS